MTTDPKRVLLVEDHAVMRQSLAFLLERQPGLGTVVQTGSLAEAHREVGGADVALVDLNLPDGSGVDLIRELRDAGVSVPVIVLTISDDPSDRARALEAGAGEVLNKAVALPEIVAAIERVLDTNRTAGD